MNITTENLQILASLAEDKEIFAGYFYLSYYRRVYSFAIMRGEGERGMNESWGIYIIFSRRSRA